MRKIYQKMYLTNKSRSKGVLSDFMDNVILKSCYSESHLPSFKRSGFTLIELLVVVLIIGILAAVALPQYQTAVIKSRLAGDLQLFSSVLRNIEMYKLANGSYPTSFEVLDVQPVCQSYSYDTDPSTAQYCKLGDAKRIKIHGAGMYLSWDGYYYLNYSFSASGKEKGVTCSAAINNSAAERACASYGGAKYDCNRANIHYESVCYSVYVP